MSPRRSGFAAGDLKSLLTLCNAAPAIARRARRRSTSSWRPSSPRPAPDPGRVFENLYFVGSAWVSAWAIRTSQGVILIDALNNADEARRLIDDGMRKVDLDPGRLSASSSSPMRTATTTAASTTWVPRYRPSVVMPAKPTGARPKAGCEFDSPLWGRPPRFDAARDRRVGDGSRLVLGDTAVILYVTPGHTEGTLTLVFDVTVGGKTHRALLWGGTAFNFGKDLPRLESYIAATRRMADVAKDRGIDVMISNHPSYDDSIAKMDAMRRRRAPPPVRDRQRGGGAQPSVDERLRPGAAGPVLHQVRTGPRSVTARSARSSSLRG